MIEEQFPWTVGDWRTQIENRNNSALIAPAVLPGILEMIDRIPDELLVLDPATDGRYTMAVSALRRNLADARGFQWAQFAPRGQTTDEDCLVMVKDILKDCPDEAPSKSTKGLTFISEDEETREAILVDLGSAESALRNAEWKAANVLSGSVIEAILFWMLKQKPRTDIAAAISGLKGKVRADLPSDDLMNRGGGWINIYRSPRNWRLLRPRRQHPVSEQRSIAT